MPISDELLSVYLRNKLEIENKDIREKIAAQTIFSLMSLFSLHVALKI